jgi:FMN-dependent NADH-azoreductase
VERYVKELKSCSKLVMAVPMWNFSIPYPLKHYLDLVVQPGLSFGVNENGAFGKIENKPVFVAYASGGQYPPGSQAQMMDHQRPYLEMILNYIGLTDIRSVRVEATLAGEETVTQRRETAFAQAREMAKTF